MPDTTRSSSPLGTTTHAGYLQYLMERAAQRYGANAPVTLAIPGRAPLDHQAAVTAAVERLNKNPPERIAVYQKARNRVLAIMRANKLAIAEKEFTEGLTLRFGQICAGIKLCPSL
jgi:hypothetical protein